jgi:hypothetical protein
VGVIEEKTKEKKRKKRKEKYRPELAAGIAIILIIQATFSSIARPRDFMLSPKVLLTQIERDAIDIQGMVFNQPTHGRTSSPTR